MSYPETLYTRRNDTNNQTPVRPQPQFWKGDISRTAPIPSQLYLWFQKNKELQMDGKLNGIDIARIKAAMKGTLNGWTGLIKKDTKIFQDLLSCIEGQVRDLNKANLIWVELKKLKDEDNGRVEAKGEESNLRS